MKIDNSLKSVGSVNSDSATSKSGKTESPKPQAGVRVALSDLSSQLQALDAHVASGGVAPDSLARAVLRTMVRDSVRTFHDA